MAIQFPADPASQTPVNTLSPTSTPVANTENGLTFVWNGTVWNAVTGGSGAVDSIIAGVGIAVDQPTGDVTITNTGGGGGGGDMPTGGGSPPEDAFYENTTVIDENYQITDGRNAGTFGPVTVNGNISVPSGSTWTVVGGADGGGGGGTSLWTRDGTTLSPATPGDDLDNIGSITAAGGLTQFYSNGSVDLYRQTITDPSNGVLTIHSDVGGTREEKILLAADGSIAAANTVQVGGNANAGTEKGCRMYPGGYQAAQANNSDSLWRGFKVGSTIPTSSILADGSITAAGGLTIQADSADVTKQVFITSSDSVSGGYYRQRVTAGLTTSDVVFRIQSGIDTDLFTIDGQGNSTFSNLIFNLEPDNDANYTTTTETYTEEETYTGPLGNSLTRDVTKTQEVRTYTGPTLDVKALLLEFQSKIETLEAAKASLEARITTLEGGN